MKKLTMDSQCVVREEAASTVDERVTRSIRSSNPRNSRACSREMLSSRQAGKVFYGKSHSDTELSPMSVISSVGDEAAGCNKDTNHFTRSRNSKSEKIKSEEQPKLVRLYMYVEVSLT